jgi:NAD(P)-dependent dehydrogenase (short-subunit alcohol dehydrogenase family)
LKTILITGAASGIGLATARRIATHMQVVIADRNYEAATRAADDIKSEGGQAYPVAVDVSVASSVARMAEDVARSVGDVHALFCNAGISPKKPFEDWTEADWDAVIHTHVKGVFLCTQAYLPQMCARKDGAIVTSGSDYSIVGHVQGSGYAAAKAGIYSLTKSIALEFAPFNIRCNSVGPGPIETPLIRKAMNDEQWAKHKAQRGDRVPMGRMGKPEEVASVVDFLVSDRAAYITGQIIHPNGGCVMW